MMTVVLRASDDRRDDRENNAACEATAPCNSALQQCIATAPCNSALQQCIARVRRAGTQIYVWDSTGVTRYRKEGEARGISREPRDDTMPSVHTPCSTALAVRTPRCDINDMISMYANTSRRVAVRGTRIGRSMGVRALAGDDGRSRQEVEAEYYKEWERLTLVPEEELNRKMTVGSFFKFIPLWIRYNALPGPVRYWLFKDRMKK